MNHSNEVRPDKPEEDEEAPSWGGVIVGLLLGIAGIGLIFYRYKQFHAVEASVSITKIEMLVYKVTGESIWALMACYGLVALAGFYLAISNYSKLKSK
ncbi:hypothetical protein [Chitinophaga arvensicola]|uniref:Uncharacterized protein n=1 Tax=Chitinophaga arvensicola TaxID=29529 RepID=A0A1I0R5A0_9BACT|nr:hypothetical protein [Chitinophaga arvensicola]SEW35713.1 hypothetical protein SAMN04488122_2301 [Chitinophaga arvensicola]